MGSSTSAAGRQLYRSAQVDSNKVSLGSVVLLEADESDREAEAAAAAGAAGRTKQQHELYVFGLVQCMYENEDGEKMAQVGACDCVMYLLCCCCVTVGPRSVAGGLQHGGQLMAVAHVGDMSQSRKPCRQQKGHR